MSCSRTALPRSATLAVKRCEASRPPDMLTMTPSTSTPAMRSAASIARRDGVFGRLEIDDRAAFDAARALVADAEHLAAMGAAAQRLGRLHRRQPRDQADDLRGADVEHRQDGALARGNLPHARRERPEAHGARPSSGMGRRPTRPPPPRERRANTRPGTRKSSESMSRSRMRDWRCSASSVAIAALRIDFRQLDLDAGLQLEIPAPLADQHARFDAGPQFVHRLREAR